MGKLMEGKEKLLDSERRTGGEGVGCKMLYALCSNPSKLLNKRADESPPDLEVYRSRKAQNHKADRSNSSTARFLI